MTPARRLHHRPGRPTPSGTRPRRMRPSRANELRRRGGATPGNVWLLREMGMPTKREFQRLGGSFW